VYAVDGAIQTIRHSCSAKSGSGAWPHPYGSHFSAVPGWARPPSIWIRTAISQPCLFSSILKLPWSRSLQNRLRAGSRTSMTEPVRAILMDLEGAAVPMTFMTETLTPLASSGWAAILLNTHRTPKLRMLWRKPDALWVVSL